MFIDWLEFMFHCLRYYLRLWILSTSLFYFFFLLKIMVAVWEMESGCHLPWRRLWKQIQTRADGLVLILGAHCMRCGPSSEPEEGSSRTSPPSWQLPVRLYLGKSLKTHVIIAKPTSGTSLVVQWLRLQASNAEGMGSIPGGGTKSPTRLKAKKLIIKHSLVNFPKSLVS